MIAEGRTMTLSGGEPERAWLAERMSEHDVPGLSIAVVDGMRVGRARAYGVKSADAKEPVTAEALLQACSISKVVTALGVLRCWPRMECSTWMTRSTRT
jgi:CubicO group peptidase (beta-lactamase class C family)